LGGRGKDFSETGAGQISSRSWFPFINTPLKRGVNDRTVSYLRGVYTKPDFISLLPTYQNFVMHASETAGFKKNWLSAVKCTMISGYSDV